MAGVRAARDGLVALTSVVLAARNAVALAFVLNGLLFASLASRIPDVRAGLDLSNRSLGLLLLAIAAGSVIALPSSGRLVERTSGATVVRCGAVLCTVGLVGAALGVVVWAEAAVAAVGLFTYGIGTGVWDVAMNVEGAEVERGLGRAILPRFHAGWSIGGILGAGLGIAATAADVSMVTHLAVVAAASLVLVLRGTAAFLPVTAHSEPERHAGSAWLEPRTLAIGVMVLCFSVAEGTANDWLTLALIDGYDVVRWVAVTGFTVFVCAMTLGRLVGPVALDRFGRAPVLWASAASAAAGILMVVAGGSVVPVAIGVVLWGLGSALGFPVAVSAAADDPARAAVRVSVVSTFGYGAFLAGPPLLGALADEFGTLDSLVFVALLMVPAAVIRPRCPAGPRCVAQPRGNDHVCSIVWQGHPAGTVEAMQILWVLGLLILLGSLTIGLTLLVTGRGLGTAGSAVEGRVGTLVDDGLQRTATAVDVLIQPELHPDEVRSRSTSSHRGEVYLVVGIGLIGVGLVAALGLLLLGAG